jgi:hypothetical protein
MEKQRGFASPRNKQIEKMKEVEIQNTLIIFDG